MNWRILVVDDEPDVRLIIRTTLEPKYEVVEAHDGLDALEKLERYQPDFVLMDVMMPLMDGFEACTSIRKKESFEKIPVMFLSALTGKDQIKKGYESGGDLYLTKPFEPSRLLRNVDTFFDTHDVPQRRRTYTIEQLSDAENNKHEPVAPGAPLPSAAPSPAPKPASSGAGVPKPRVMIVDDDQEIRQLCALTLQDEYEVVSAVDGMDAIEKLVRYQPDLLILDVMMPKMNGIQLCQSLRLNRAFARLPILVCSAKGSSKDQSFASRVGADAYLVKPFDPSEMRAKVRELQQKQGFKVRPKTLQIDQISALEGFRDQKDVFQVGKDARGIHVSGETWLGSAKSAESPPGESRQPAPPKPPEEPPAASSDPQESKKKKKSFFGFRRE